MTPEENKLNEIFHESMKKGGSPAAIANRAADMLAADTELDEKVRYMLILSHYRHMADDAMSDRHQDVNAALDSPPSTASTNGYGRRVKLKVEHKPSTRGLAYMKADELSSKLSLLENLKKNEGLCCIIPPKKLKKRKSKK